MGIGKRIRHFREKAGLKLQQLEALSGVDTGTISALEIRDSARSEKFPALAKAFGMTLEQLADEAYDPDLLVVTDKEKNWAGEVVRIAPKTDGDFEAPMLSRATEPPAPYDLQPIHAWEYEDELPAGEFVMVPRLGVQLSAGAGRGPSQVEIQFDEKQPLAFQATWIREQRLKPRKLAALSASGRSMEPTIHHGDTLLVDTSQTEVQDGNVYALWYEGGARVKRLFGLPGGGLRIRSDNPEHPTLELGPDYLGHVRIIGRVVHRSGRGGL